MNRDVEKDSRHPPSLVELWRTGPSSTEVHFKETCHSTKRTHFVFAYFLVYHISLQEFTSFAGAFANGFVLEKRTHFRGVPRSVWSGVSSMWAGCGEDVTA